MAPRDRVRAPSATRLDRTPWSTDLNHSATILSTFPATVATVVAPETVELATRIFAGCAIIVLGFIADEVRAAIETRRRRRREAENDPPPTNKEV